MFSKPKVMILGYFLDHCLRAKSMCTVSIQTRRSSLVCLVFTSHLQKQSLDSNNFSQLYSFLSKILKCADSKCLQFLSWATLLVSISQIISFNLMYHLTYIPSLSSFLTPASDGMHPITSYIKSNSN